MKAIIEGKASYSSSKCGMHDEFFAIGSEGYVFYGRHLEINNWPHEFFDFIEKHNGQNIRLTLKLEKIE